MADLKKWLSKPAFRATRGVLEAVWFPKEGRTVSRDCGSYWERINFQGSAWNDANSGRFYINVGIEFKDLAPRKLWSLMPHTHWADRLERIVKEAPSQWGYDSQTDRAGMKTQMGRHLAAVGPLLQARAAEIREEYLTQQEKRRKP